METRPVTMATGWQPTRAPTAETLVVAMVVQDGVEQCDDGNTATEECEYGAEACVVCAADCTEQAGDTDLCGDGTVDAEEACDDGNVVTEECEYGVEACVVCAADCTEQAGDTDLCGDGTVDEGEICDDGNEETETCDYGLEACVVCAADCTEQPGDTSVCGDGVVDAENGEECDDADADNTDACTDVCERARCGDGFIQAGEDCDGGDGAALTPSRSVC